MSKSIVISSGHGKYVRGASGYLDEVDEARRVVNRVAELLNEAGVLARTYHDDTSKSQSENLDRIVDKHNSYSRDLDISVHFNAYETTSKPMGVEVLYVTQEALASSLSAAMAAAEGLPNRGGKYRGDLAFLNGTSEPAILIETCFVDSSADSTAYEDTFEALCRTIAETVGEVSIGAPPDRPPVEPPQRPPVEPPNPPGVGEVAKRPMLSHGARGELVRQVQLCLSVEPVDGLFGDDTEAAVKHYQNSEHLDDDGVVGPDTWTALEQDYELPPYRSPNMLTAVQQQQVAELAAESDIADYNWDDRGEAPSGYIKGMALAYGEAYLRYRRHDPVFLALGTAAGDDEIDALAWYHDEFAAMGMDNSRNSVDTMRHLYVLLTGLGMRESSGQHCEGRDTSADNVSSDTAEAGLFQTSWNAKAGSPTLFQAVYERYYADSTIGYLDVFEQGVSCSSSSWGCYGSGEGYMFQFMCKNQPTFAVETAAATLRRLRQHYGPINRKEAELRADADHLYQEIEALLEPRVA
jgi:hypothetical protein